MSKSTDLDNNNDNDIRPTDIPLNTTTRRDFLQAAAAVAGATLLSSCLSGGDDSSDPMPGNPVPVPGYLDKIDRLVVVMLENRSFDNLLGYLYAPDAVPTCPTTVLNCKPGQTFDGLGGGTYVNQLLDGTTVAAHPHPFDPATGTTFDWTHPDPNSGEGFTNTRSQLEYGADGKATMRGFLSNYYNEFVRTSTGLLPTADQYGAIMGSYTPAQVPVLSGLAQNFAVFDHWHAGVPSETYCNRAFFHASTSYGYTENGSSSGSGAASWTRWQDPPMFVSKNTIFDHMETASINGSGRNGAKWGVYFNPPNCPDAGEQDFFNVVSSVGLTGLVHYEVGTNYGPPSYSTPVSGNPALQRFWPFAQFFDDVKTGQLPQYTFIEPLYGSMPFPLPAAGGTDFHPPGDVRNGDEVVRQVYEAIRTSGSGVTDYTTNTMILVVFDEHGGTYDHVPPGTAPSPGIAYPSPEYGFDFTKLGVRVPAIAISSYTLPGTIVNEPMHHAAIINTLMRKFIYPSVRPGTAKPFLTQRDANLNGGDLGPAYQAARPSDKPWPIFPPPVFIPTPVVGPCKLPT